MYAHLFKTLDADTKLGFVELCSMVTAENASAWAYISILPSRYEAYKHAQQHGTPITLHDYGHILLSGTGEAPSDAVKAALENTYGIRHDLAGQIAEALQQHQSGATP